MIVPLAQVTADSPGGVTGDSGHPQASSPSATRLLSALASQVADMDELQI